ncbi:hypothetical protein [Marinicrinis sediminis]|uniref:Lipoprotein n=1 Tax=Marinicrinis sediminis TaxID=1652465 RepID=A0ABW5R738_9BACL
MVRFRPAPAGKYAVALLMGAMLCLLPACQWEAGQPDAQAAEQWLNQALLSVKGTEVDFIGEAVLIQDGQEQYRAQGLRSQNEAIWQLKPVLQATRMSSVETDQPMISPYVPISSLPEAAQRVIQLSPSGRDDQVQLEVVLKPEAAKSALTESLAQHGQMLKEQFAAEADRQPEASAWLVEKEQQLQEVLKTMEVVEAIYTLTIDRADKALVHIDVETALRYDWKGEPKSEQMRGSYELQSPHQQTMK